jgi:ferric-dicitrate binding protein FerR (iron transport regulator)
MAALYPEEGDIGAVNNYAAYITDTIPYGRRASLYLSDSSLVQLNSGAIFRHPATFNDTLREVELLAGEAYFSITADARRPFMVKSGNNCVHVLGTQFNIRLADTHQYVTLTQGRIAFAAGTAAARILLPGQQLCYNEKNGQVHVSSGIDTVAVISWMQGGYLMTPHLLRSFLLSNITITKDLLTSGRMLFPCSLPENSGMNRLKPYCVRWKKVCR